MSTLPLSFPMMNLGLIKAKEIAPILDYADTKRAVQRHVDEQDSTSFADLIKGDKNSPLQIHPQTVFINESGLYSLTISSNKPFAKDFQRWITSFVLSSLRKTDVYQY